MLIDAVLPCACSIRKGREDYVMRCAPSLSQNWIAFEPERCADRSFVNFAVRFPAGTQTVDNAHVLEMC